MSPKQNHLKNYIIIKSPNQYFPPLALLLGNTPFFRRKVYQRTLHRNHHFIFAKVFEVSQETFYKKFLVSGFGADAPTYNAHKKHGIAVLLNCRNMLELPFQTSAARDF